MKPESNNKVDDDDDDDEKYAFPSNGANLDLPEPPTDVSPIYMNATTATSEITTANDNTPANPSVLLKVPTRFNYVTTNTTKVIIGRDADGKDYSATTSTTVSNNETDDSKNPRSANLGIGWFTNHRTIYVANGRLHPYTLHTNGFELLSLPHPTKSLNEIDYTNRNDVLEKYYPYCEQLLQQVLNERFGDQVQVWAFDHNVRIQPLPSDEASEAESSPPNDGTTTKRTVIQKPIGLVHGDYTTISAPRRLQLLGEPPKINDVHYDQFNSRTIDGHNKNDQETRNSLLDPNLVQECLSSSSSPGRRYAFINVWKNIDYVNPVMALPLGCVDATTVSMNDDLRTLELHYTDRIGENYLACRPPKQPEQQTRREHQWVYYPQMTHEEVLLLKTWDSAGTDIIESERNQVKEYVSTMALHSAFIDPTTPSNNMVRRQSIEVRCVAIWV